jgi:23S rRNA (cytidine1920-2'-O)/16S rRNA (cytidine1409-2'-O)-methyltransferase
MPDEGARLDAELVRRGLARSRALAVEAIQAGLVSIDGATAVKASTKVGPDAVLALEGGDQYVSRGAHKLIGALDVFAIDPSGRFALDAGASTGGFTQVLLERGAARVIAVDVGHGQLATVVQDDPRVVSLEGLNIRELTREQLAPHLGDPAQPLSLFVGDLSFISLRHVLKPLRDVANPDADFVLLVKPQFEVGRGGIREGIVRDPALRREAVSEVLWAAWDLGLGTAGVIPSPILGGNGNHEYLVWLTSTGQNPGDWRAVIDALE